MMLHKRMICMAIATAFAIAPMYANAQTAGKPAATAKTAKAPKPAKERVLKGSVVALTGDTLTIRGDNKKDAVFMLNSGTQKPASLAAGAKITVHYKDEANKHIATNIESAK